MEGESVRILTLSTFAMTRILLPLFSIVSAALIALTFGASIEFGFAPIDDSFLIVGNLAVISPTMEAVRLAWTTFDPELYIPLTILSYHVDFLVHHLDPTWMHIEGLVLHMFNTILVFILLRRWSGGVTPAALGALLFAIHPVQTETVVWLSARKDLLMTLFSLASLLAFERSLVRRPVRWMTLATLLFAIAMLCKPSAILLPIVMTLRMVMVSGGEWRGWPRLLPLAGVSVITGVIGIFGKSHLLGLRNFWEVIGTAAQSVVWTLGKLVHVVPLRVSYDLPHPSSMTMVVCAAFCLVLLALAWRTRKKLPMVTLGIVWFLVLLAPALLNSRVGGIPTLAADRYAYLPMIGIFVAVLAAGERWLQTNALRRTAMAAGCLVIALCVPATRAEVASWADPATLFATSLQRQPSAISTRIALSNVQKDQKQITEAFETLKEGLRYGDSAQLHLAAGYVYAKAGDPASAKEQFGLALAMDEKSPDPHYALGSLAMQTGDARNAEDNLRQAIALDESFVEARIDLAQLLVKKRDLIGAEKQLLAAVAWNPSSGAAHAQLARIYTQIGKPDEAKIHAEKARLLGLRAL